MKIKCVAIDDEPLALRQITSYIERIEFLELVDSWSDPHRALNTLNSNNDITLLFVDIDMPDINGIELVKRLDKRYYIIFTTAYSQYAIDGFRLSAVDYLLKPFSFSEFEKAVNKVRYLSELKEISDEQITEHNHREESPLYISVKSDYKVVPVRVSDIIYIESIGEYIRLNLRDETSITTLYRLKNMEAELPATQFARVHRSYIVNIYEVRNYTRAKITLDKELQLPIGDSYRETLVAKLDEFYRKEPC